MNWREHHDNITCDYLLLVLHNDMISYSQLSIYQTITPNQGFNEKKKQRQLIRKEKATEQHNACEELRRILFLFFFDIIIVKLT